MAENTQDLQKALEIYDILCRTLEAQDWPYEKIKDELMIKCNVRGEDLPMEVFVYVDAGRHVVRLFSPLPVIVPEDNRLNVAVAVSAVNNRLVDGNFDYDVTNGRIHYRKTHSYLESTIGQERFVYMLYSSVSMIDRYNDKFLMLAKDMISLGQFLDMFNN